MTAAVAPTCCELATVCRTLYTNLSRLLPCREAATRMWRAHRRAQIESRLNWERIIELCLVFWNSSVILLHNYHLTLDVWHSKCLTYRTFSLDPAMKSHRYQGSFAPKWKIVPICSKIVHLEFWLVKIMSSRSIKLIFCSNSWNLISRIVTAAVALTRCELVNWV